MEVYEGLGKAGNPESM